MGGELLISELERRGLDRFSAREGLLAYMRDPLTAHDLERFDNMVGADEVDAALIERYGTADTIEGRAAAGAPLSVRAPGAVIADAVYDLHVRGAGDVLLAAGEWLRGRQTRVLAPGRRPLVEVSYTVTSPAVPEAMFVVRTKDHPSVSWEDQQATYRSLEAAAAWSTLADGRWPVASPPAEAVRTGA